MKKIIGLIGLLVSNCIFAQQSAQMKELLVMNDTLREYFIIDSMAVHYWCKSKSRCYLCFKDRLQKDTIETELQGIPIKVGNTIYINAQTTNDSKYKKIRFNERKFDSFNQSFQYDIGLRQVFDNSTDSLPIYIYDPKTDKRQLLNAFNRLNTHISNIDIYINQVFFLDKSTAFVQLCFDDGSAGDGCLYPRYYLVNSKNAIDITTKIQPFNSTVEFNSEIEMVSSDNGYIRERYRPANSTKDQTRLFDKNFNFIDSLLNFSEMRVNGYNMQKNEIQFYYLVSPIDTIAALQHDTRNLKKAEYVLVPYRFNPFLEVAMYNIYRNTLLSVDNFKDFTKYEMDILRNMIFARHNYGFSSKFYQAYFNLYEFYGNDEARVNRLSDVSNLLTPNDKKNLELIKRMSTKK